MRRLAVVALLVLSACATTVPRPDLAPHRKYRVVAYVRGAADIASIGATKLTHVNYAFAKVSPLGVVVFDDPDAPAHIAQLQALKAKNPDLKVLVSVGGWGADFFSDAAVDAGARCRFADSAIDMIKRYSLDGIDLDWEYPGQPGPGIIHRAEDKENFTLMLAQLRSELDLLSDARHRRGFDRYQLTIASTGGRYFDHTEMDKLHRYLDFVNIMTYDLAGPWSSTTGHHTPLYQSASAAPWAVSSEQYVKQHLAAGIPPEKIVVGAAFYGRGWRGAWGGASGLYRPYDQYESGFPYWLIARDYVGAAGYQRMWDADAHAPYLWNPSTGRFITYDDPQSLSEKAKFVKDHHLGGIMYWEHSHDPQEVLVDAIYRSLQ